jgi:drug/metabolite transporter (DMT)-like permease
VTGFVLAAIFASAILHATWNALLKRSDDTSAGSVVIVAGAALLSIIAGLIAGEVRVPIDAWPYLLATGLIEGVYFITLSRALTELPLGSAYGISRGLGLLLIWPFSILFFGETLGLEAGLGAALLSVGLLMLVSRVDSRRGLVFAVACGLSITAYPLAYKRALMAGVDPCPLFAISLAVALPILVLGFGYDRWRRLRSAVRARPGRLSLGAAICAASFLLFLVALKAEGAGRVTALRNTSVLFASIFGWLSGEPRTPRSMASAFAITAGAVLLTH